MKQVNVRFEESEYKQMRKAKAKAGEDEVEDLTWRKFLLSLVEEKGKAEVGGVVKRNDTNDSVGAQQAPS